VTDTTIKRALTINESIENIFPVPLNEVVDVPKYATWQVRIHYRRLVDKLYTYHMVGWSKTTSKEKVENV
jgi:hypothetical protein